MSVVIAEANSSNLFCKLVFNDWHVVVRGVPVKANENQDVDELWHISQTCFVLLPLVSMLNGHASELHILREEAQKTATTSNVVVCHLLMRVPNSSLMVLWMFSVHSQLHCSLISRHKMFRANSASAVSHTAPSTCKTYTKTQLVMTYLLWYLHHMPQWHTLPVNALTHCGCNFTQSQHLGMMRDIWGDTYVYLKQINVIHVHFWIPVISWKLNFIYSWYCP